HPASISGLIAPIAILGKVEFFVPLVLVAYVIGHFLSYLSSITVEKYSVWTLGYPSRYLLGHTPPGYFSPAETAEPRRVVRFVVALLLLPLVLTELVLNWFSFRPLYAKPIDPTLRRRIGDCLRSFDNDHGLSLGDNITPDGEERDNFRLVYHFALEHAQAHVPKMQNFVALYGFTRTLALEAVIFAWGAAYWTWTGQLCRGEGSAIAVAAAVTAAVFYLDFNKFYRKFSLEAFMAFVTVWNAELVKTRVRQS
ncbi:MAG: hypothetical protein AB1793_09560, partial [Candidatus Thermoplasmatota archaeon]